MQRLFSCILLLCLTGAAESVFGQKPDTSLVATTSLPENLRFILGQAEKQYYGPRVRTIHKLPDNLPADQVKACYAFRSRRLKSRELPDLEFNGLKNELVFVLMQQKRRPAALAGSGNPSLDTPARVVHKKLYPRER